MAKVKIHRNMTLIIDGRGWTPKDGVFDLPDEQAEALEDGGSLQIVDEESVTEPETDPDPVVDDTDTDTNTDGVFDLSDEQAEADIKTPTLKSTLVEMINLPSVTPTIFDVLVIAGIETVEQLANTSAEDLIALKYIGSSRARNLIQDAEDAI